MNKNPVDPVTLLETGAVQREELSRAYARRAEAFKRQAREMRQTARELRRISEGKEVQHHGGQG
jgi:hypothetical protein